MHFKEKATQSSGMRIAQIAIAGRSRVQRLASVPPFPMEPIYSRGMGRLPPANFPIVYICAVLADRDNTRGATDF